MDIVCAETLASSLSVWTHPGAPACILNGIEFLDVLVFTRPVNKVTL
jgi:hypothetical protein